MLADANDPGDVASGDHRDGISPGAAANEGGAGRIDGGAGTEACACFTGTAGGAARGGKLGGAGARGGSPGSGGGEARLGATGRAGSNEVSAVRDSALGSDGGDGGLATAATAFAGRAGIVASSVSNVPGFAPARGFAVAIAIGGVSARMMRFSGGVSAGIGSCGGRNAENTIITMNRTPAAAAQPPRM